MSTGNLAVVFLVAVLVVAGVYVVTTIETAVFQTLLAVTCGMMATLPTVLALVVFLLRQQNKGQEMTTRSNQVREAPPVIVIQGGAPTPNQYSGYLAPPVAPSYMTERDVVEMVGNDYT